MMDDTYPPHLHGWDGINVVFGNDPHMYVSPDWEQNSYGGEKIVNDQSSKGS